MPNGKVKKVVPQKGYGFIRSDSDGREYFFHQSDFVGHWNDLEIDSVEMEVPVSFEINPNSPKGPRAQNVHRLDFPNQSV